MARNELALQEHNYEAREEALARAFGLISAVALMVIVAIVGGVLGYLIALYVK